MKKAALVFAVLCAVGLWLAGAKISVSTKWYDLWIGAYVDRKHKTVYICPWPTRVIEISL